MTRRIGAFILIFSLLFLVPMNASASTPAPTATLVMGLGDGSPFQDGPLSEAGLADPKQISVGKEGRIWIVDGCSLRLIDKGELTTVASLWDEEAQLKPYGLDTPEAITSFLPVTVKEVGDSVYISGLIFKRDRKVYRVYEGWDVPRQWRMGYAYNILLQYKAGALKVLDVTFAAERIHSDDVGGDNPGGIYNYHYKLLWPHFTVGADGSLYIVRRHDGPDAVFVDSRWGAYVSPAHELVKYKDGEWKVLYRYDSHGDTKVHWDNAPFYGVGNFGAPGWAEPGGWQNYTATVSPDESMATIYDGGRNMVYRIDLATQTVTGGSRIASPGTKAQHSLHMPVIRGDSVYFLDNQGIWRTFMDGQWSDSVLDADEVTGLPTRTSIISWDVAPDGTIYLIDYWDQQVYKITGSPLQTTPATWGMMIPEVNRIVVADPVRSENGQVLIPLDPLAGAWSMSVRRAGTDQVALTLTTGRRLTVPVVSIDGKNYLALATVKNIWLKQYPAYEVTWDADGQNLVFTPQLDKLPEK